MTTSKEVVAEIDKLTEQGRATREIIDIIYENYNENINYRQMRRLMTGARGNAVRDKPKLDYLNSNGKGERIKINNRQEAYREQLKINQDGSQEHATVIQMKSGQDKDVDFVLRAHGYDPTEWKIVSVVNNFWQQGSSENGTRDLYQSKINVKPIEKEFSVNDVISAANNKIKSVKVNNKKVGKDNIVIPLFDMHFGMTRLKNLENHLIQITEILKKGYKRVEIIIGGDVLHSDYITKTQTSSNTQLDHVETIRALNEAESFFSTLISTSLKYSEIVEVKAVSGNHDTDSQFYFIWGMSKKFPQVPFDNKLNGERLAFQFGKIGIMVAHGNLALKRLPMLFANEFSDIWASSSYRMVASGHFHTEKYSDVDGVVMHQFGTVKPNDPYEKANGYTVARKHIQMMEFGEDRLKATYEIE